MSTLQCPHCQRALRIPDAARSRSIQCPACQSIFVAEPSTISPEPTPIPTEIDDPEHPDDTPAGTGNRRGQGREERDRRRRPAPPREAPSEEWDSPEEEEEEGFRRRRKKGSSVGWIILLCVLGALVLVGGVVGLGTYLVLKKTAIADSDWVEFVVPGGNCRVSMPGQPSYLPMQQGAFTLQKYVLVSKHDRGAYAVMYGDLPADLGANTDQLLDAMVQAEANGQQGTLKKNTPISLSGYTGREMEIALPGNARTVGRVFVNSTRLYMLEVFGRQVSPTSPDVTRFLNSFQIDRSAATAPPLPGNPLNPGAQPAPPPAQPMNEPELRIGMTEADVIARMGAPEGVKNEAGRKWLRWPRGSGIYVVTLVDGRTTSFGSYSRGANPASQGAWQKWPAQ